MVRGVRDMGARRKQLTLDASLQVRKTNYERIFDAARQRVRAWEKANVR